MSIFKVEMVLRNPKQEDIVSPAVSAIVDTGSELSWVPSEILAAAGITPRRKRLFLTATGQSIQRSIGYAIVSAEGFETTDEIVFGEPGDMTLLGVRTLEGFGVTVDSLAHRLVATATLAAACAA